MPDASAPALRLVRTCAAGARLHTATLRRTDTDGTLELFHACRVAGPEDVRARLSRRVGRALAYAAVVRVGVDPCDPVVAALLSASLVGALRGRDDLPGHALSGGGDLHILQWRV